MGMITFSVKSISDVLQNSSLKIPEYQRPYKWERRHIRNLFYDIREAIDSKKSEYRIGSIILHNKNADNIDIVDGQQRVAAKAIYDTTLANYAASGTFQRKKCQKLFQELAVSASPRDFVARIDTDLLGNFSAEDIINQFKEEA